ncbi:YpiF family protein [Bacillus kwashiorkori]|uniref:YpiF family protein n=1 Tax=Bacillus kwashiorkori TaxID=1522318 RepID=UPI000780717E|nr:YpiF family protein [Bacillus kwashiorkori]
MKETRWNAKDSLLYLDSKQYVDTVLIPVIPISLRDNCKESANAAEFIQLLCLQLEKQFRGRILLMPSFPYLPNSNDSQNVFLLEPFMDELKSANFKHIVFLSTESVLKKYVEDFGGDFIWVPSIPLDSMEDSYKLSIMDNQVKQLLNIIVDIWQETETS